MGHSPEKRGHRLFGQTLQAHRPDGQGPSGPGRGAVGRGHIGPPKPVVYGISERHQPVVEFPPGLVQGQRPGGGQSGSAVDHPGRSGPGLSAGQAAEAQAQEAPGRTALGRPQAGAVFGRRRRADRTGALSPAHRLHLHPGRSEQVALPSSRDRIEPFGGLGRDPPDHRGPGPDHLDQAHRRLGHGHRRG